MGISLCQKQLLAGHNKSIKIDDWKFINQYYSILFDTDQSISYSADYITMNT